MRRPVNPLHCSNHADHRRGISLIELVVLISILAVVAGSSCVLIAKMMQSSRYQADILVQRRTMHLWQLQFQQDGREAQSATLNGTPPSAPKIQFQLPDSRVVTYQMVDERLERHVDGKLAARWVCGAGAWSFSLPEDARIARAEFHPSVPLPNQDTVPPDSNHARPLHEAGMPLHVDVALASGIYRLTPAEAR